MPAFNKSLRAVALLGVLAALGGCMETTDYFDRRDTIALGGGDALAADRVTEMVDPWPAESANKNIAFNGQKMQSAVQRYRMGQIIPPAPTGTSSSYGQQQGSGNAPPATDPSGSPPPAPKP